MKNALRILVLGIAILALGTSANADTVGTLVISGCGNCNGAVLTLTIVHNGGNSYTATLTVDTTNFVAPAAGVNYISSVAFQAGGSSIVSATLTSDPGGSWTTFGNTNSTNNDCTGSGSGWVCSQADPTVAVSGGEMTWVWDFENSGGDLGDVWTIHLKWNDEDGDTDGHLISNFGTPTTTTRVAEPGSLILLGMGLIGMAGIRRRLS